ncbi:MAG TPA: UDP-N-acetylmuramate--L-alanine ligase, partial [Longimicrobiales bacterium]|nr:UDP-N-acetylmuramate--L-alanine ligase [Longimicrobiales bacterium]
LGEWVNRSRVLAVAGTHGKTTTTAMATEILASAGLDPTGFVGGRVRAWNGNLRFGGEALFVVEADEYDRSFHALRPEVAVVTNLEADHLDVFGSLEGVRAAFLDFAMAVPEEGRVAFCGDDPEASGLAVALGPRAYSYGTSPGSQLRGEAVSLSRVGSHFRAVEAGRDRGRLELAVPGIHNVRNALGAAAAARALGVEWRPIREGLAAFEGVARRFHVLGEARGVTVVDDYAHHPTEIRATLEAARAAFPERRKVVVFQPHLFSRTRDFAEEFGRALGGADEAWITDVYPAREEPIPGVTGELVADAAREAGAPAVRYHAELRTLAPALAPTLARGDVCLTMGAGTVEALGPELLRELEREGPHG